MHRGAYVGSAFSPIGSDQAPCQHWFSISLCLIEAIFIGTNRSVLWCFLRLTCSWGWHRTLGAASLLMSVLGLSGVEVLLLSFKLSTNLQEDHATVMGFLNGTLPHKERLGCTGYATCLLSFVSIVHLVMCANGATCHLCQSFVSTASIVIACNQFGCFWKVSLCVPW